MLERSKYELARHLEEFSDEYEEEFLCDVLGKLSDDGDMYVRVFVALNPTIPESCACDILEKLSADNSSFVRRGVARNPNLPASCACDILEKLSDDGDTYVRSGVARNPLWANCPKE